MPALVEPAALRTAALALTWITAAGETALALLFLAPLPARLPAMRHAALIAFCAATYALAPVEGFGWLLLCMGCAAAPVGPSPDAGWTRSAYVACYGLLVVYAEIDLAAWLAP